MTHHVQICSTLS